MKLQLLLSFILITGQLTGQTTDTLLYERFETGGTSFTLNSADENGVSAATGYNQWIINDAYTGGSGQLICSGFPTTFTVPNTPSQPIGTAGGPATQYMHMISDAGQASGILNCSYLAANGLCGNDEYNFTRMTSDVNTSAYDSVTVSFLWLCSGAPTIYGEIYYSLNGGTTWTLVTIPSAQYSNQSTWATSTVSLPVFAGQSTLRFGFRFVNEVSFSAGDPGFAIDEFLITASVIGPPQPPPVAVFSVSDSAICNSTCIDFTDMSTNNPTNWLWIFQGSTTSFSTQQNPASICYNTPGNYSVTLIVSNASGNDTLTTNTITVYGEPLAPTITVSGDTLFATSGFASYEWFLNGALIPFAGSNSYVTTLNGSYSVIVTDSNGCSAESLPLVLNTGIAESGAEALPIYPNPTSGKLNIETGTGQHYLTVYDGVGKIVYQNQTNENGNISIELSTLPPGHYSIRLITEKGTVRISKFLKL